MKLIKAAYEKTRKIIPFLPTSPITKLTETFHLEYQRYCHNIEVAMPKFSPEIQELFLMLKNKEFCEILKTKSFEDFGNILTFLMKTENVQGNIVECGTYKGATTIVMAEFLKRIGSKKKIYTFDTFSGLPYEDQYATNKNVVGKFGDSSYEAIIEKFHRLHLDEKIVVTPGLFEDTLKSTLENEQISFVFLDCDLYQSSKFAIEAIWPKISDNGVMVFDDYERDPSKPPRWGMTKAVKDYFGGIVLDPIPYIIKN